MGDILQELRGKIKGYLGDQQIFTSLVLILVSLTAFGLGRQSVAEADRPETAAPQVIEEEEVISTSSLPSTYYVGSKNGTVYHLPHCSGASRISEANKVVFKSKEEAVAAGYRPAANCKGI